jgi:hypothetical protein
MGIIVSHNKQVVEVRTNRALAQAPDDGGANRRRQQGYDFGWVFVNQSARGR